MAEPRAWFGSGHGVSSFPSSEHMGVLSVAAGEGSPVVWWPVFFPNHISIPRARVLMGMLCGGRRGEYLYPKAQSGRCLVQGHTASCRQARMQL